MGNRVGMAQAGLYAGGIVLALLAGTFGFVLAGGAIWGWLKSIPGAGWWAIVGVYLFLWLDHKLTGIHETAKAIKALQADIHRLVEMAKENRDR